MWCAPHTHLVFGHPSVRFCESRPVNPCLLWLSVICSECMFHYFLWVLWNKNNKHFKKIFSRFLINQYTGKLVSTCLAQACKPPVMSLNWMESDLKWFFSFWTAIWESLPLLHTTYTGRGWSPADWARMWLLRRAKLSSLSTQVTGKSERGLRNEVLHPYCTTVRNTYFPSSKLAN